MQESSPMQRVLLGEQTWNIVNGIDMSLDVGQGKTLYLSLDQHTPRHADFPFQIVHIYHARLNVYSEHSPVKVVEVAWATFAIDAYSRRHLAIYLTDDPPSYHSDMMVLRESVRRYARLPNILVTDRGNNFNNLYFERFLSLYKVRNLERIPSEHSEHSVVESLFGMMDTDFVRAIIHDTPSNGSQREKTEISAALHRNIAWTLAEFYDKLCEWSSQVYDQKIQPGLGRDPSEAYRLGMALDDGRLHRMISYDGEFLASVLPTTRSGQAMVTHEGVKILGHLYWNDEFIHPAVRGTRVPIRYDPFDGNYALAFVRMRWLQCRRLRLIAV